MQTTPPPKSFALSRAESTKTIADAVRAVITASAGQSQLALSIEMMSREHYQRFGEKPKLRTQVAVEHWPIVITAPAVGRGKVVTRYVISSDGDVILERSYARSHANSTTDSNVYTSVPPRL